MSTAPAPPWLLEIRIKVGDEGLLLLLERLRDGRADMVHAAIERDRNGNVIATFVDPPKLVARRRGR